MDRVLDLLATVTPASAKLAVDLLVPDLFVASTSQQKHKLKTRISALLKSSGSSRAVGAVLARRALVDWSIVKSHGATWAPILLHVLDLPDRVCWAPAIRTLTFLYTQVHGKADLSREVASAKVGEFVKRLVKILPQTNANLFFAVTRMLQLYPTQCRPYLNKLLPILDVAGGEQALASLCLAEKAGADVWMQRVNELLSHLEKNPNGNEADQSKISELVRAHQLAKLREYIYVASDLKAKVPAQRLLRVLNAGLQSYKPQTTLQVLDFMLATRTPLETLYIQAFDSLVYSLVDCVDLGRTVAVRVAEFMAWELNGVGWTSENYAQVLTRLTKKLVAVANKRDDPIAADGLADYVQNNAAFKGASLTTEETASLASFFIEVVINVPGIPQSVRTQLDYYLLNNGTVDEIAKATLYAGRFSILPLAIKRLPKLDGLETLVHPRFPPLNISRHALQIAQDEHQEEPVVDASDKQEHYASTTVNYEPVQTPTKEEVTPNTTQPQETSNSPEAAETEVHLPAIPESNKPVHHSELEAVPPEKRQKLSEPEIEPPATAPISTTVNVDEADDDDEEELVIPTLTMDSD